MNRRDLIKKLIAAGLLAAMPIKSTSAKQLKETPQLHFIGLSDAGANIIRHFHSKGMRGKYTIISTELSFQLHPDIDHIQIEVRNRTSGFNPYHPSIHLCDNGENMNIPDSVYSIFNNNDLFVLLSGLGGYTGSRLMESLSRKLEEKQKDYRAICSLPFRFEGIVRRSSALYTLNSIGNINTVHAFELEDLRKDHPDMVLSNAFNKANEEFWRIFNKQPRMGFAHN
ncbi:hypothetical protein QA597_10480 [Marinilabiliaceae bacterium ANBcel2]|nr:hypothetical protein [Marinilabiliaceae bacterium ANBcel2]